MRARRWRGFTVAEIAVYSLLSLLAAGLLVLLIRESRRLFGRTTATFLVDRMFDRALTMLRRDLMETSLSGIRVFPGPPRTPGEQEPPGLTVVASGGNLTAEGVPRWSHHVFYTLKAESAAPGTVTGDLLRWEKPMETPGLMPEATPLLPSRGLSGARAETVLRGVQLPGSSIPGIQESAVGPRGGFQVTFVRRGAGPEALSPWNPAEVSLGQTGLDCGGNTRLVDVELRVWRPADSVSASQYAVVRCRVCPRTCP